MEELEQRQVKRARYEDLSFGMPVQTLDSDSFCTPVCQKRLERIDQKFDESSINPTCDSGEVTPKSSPSSVKGSIPEQQLPFEQLSLDERKTPFPHSEIEFAIISLFKPSVHEEMLNKITNIRAKIDFYLDLNQNFQKTLELAEGIEKEEKILFDKLDKLFLKQSRVREIDQSEVLWWQSEIINSFNAVWRQLEIQSKETLQSIIATHKFK